MSSELRESLPILSGLDADEEAHIRALIAVGSPEDQALAAAYEADAAALAAVAASHQGDHTMLAGFADSIMAAVAAEQVDRQPRELVAVASEGDETRAPAPILRPTFGVQLLLAIAAMLLAGLGLAIVAFDPETDRQPIVAEVEDSLPVGAEPSETQPEAPVDSRPLLTPKRAMRKRGRRMPGGLRNGIVPVDGRGARSGHRQMRGDPLADALRRMWQVRGKRPVPTKKKDEREVDF
jgi:hypothetical protein